MIAPATGWLVTRAIARGSRIAGRARVAEPGAKPDHFVSRSSSATLTGIVVYQPELLITDPFDLSKERLFRQALSDPSHPQPGVINTDQARLYGAAIAAVKAEGTLRHRCRHRPVQYLNNILEQDHRAIKRRVKAKQSFREFHAARRTIAGYEAIHMIRKGQARWVSSDDVRQQNQFIDQLFDLAA